MNAVIDKNGKLYTWGENLENCLGHAGSKDYNNPILL